MADNKSANWNIWGNVPELPLWEAVALSLDIEPRSIQFNPNNWATRQKIDGVTEEFEDRLLVAERNRLGGKLPSQDRNYGTPVLGHVNLGIFAAWALQLTPRWQVPERFAALSNEEAFTAAIAAAQEKSTAATKSPEKPLGTRERETLLKLVIGMAIDGYGYDPSANRSDVIPEICRNLATHHITVSDDTLRKYLNEASKLLPQKPGKSGM